MKLAWAILCASCALLLPARATVVIYKGSEHQKQTFTATPNYGGAAVLGYYLVVDYDAGKVGQILTFTAGGKKQYATYPPVAMSFATPPLPGGKTATVIAMGNARNDAANDFAFSCFYVLGTNQSLTVRNTPVVTQAIAPRNFTGSFPLVFAAPDGSRVILRSIFASFQSALTLKENAANLTIDAAYQDLVTQLEAKGYTPGF